ncbi:MAG: peptide chain release factor 3 [Bombilactobacillus mellifer]|uniref:peptide chain release factor 3 n=1 Tax=Bombilactobacillus mellifer TaxID=1218492 RepID=UPI0023F2A579|nr:peptide chain release factor 3 [Bombilactobacillus mellifer]MCT6826905.1 peptide chain release factor 3 [Bombilactobacillus mellifer]MCT6843858.1 peptide chain release factor 3 [Bombilactobacillus mellifer]MCT6894755.1 peptide chain release factor 3 [Bombilactobacillus mellifer]
MKSESLAQEVAQRRTFAIISHPDAGKTTITEQMLLFGGVIRSAGTVKGKKSGNYATSDWMEIEKKRGISVTSSVMEFNYHDKHINILDTPGHEDFSEDTYRTLMAVDAAVMVIDSAKGIEAQTKKLFKVVKQRGIPIFTFMNKLDRDGREPLDLIGELEDLLQIEGCAMNWPMGSGKNLVGLYDLYHNQIELYHAAQPQNRFLPLDEQGHLPADHPLTHDSIYRQTLEEVGLIQAAGNPFDQTKIAQGEQTPVFFGSALTNFGVQTFLDEFIKMAPAPSAHQLVDGRQLAATDDQFSGFVFKIQANMNPKHRDRIAFVRIGSGEFEPGMDVTLQRTQKSLRLNNATEFMSDQRERVKKAVAGDIVGLYDTGNFQIGDTLYSGKTAIEYPALPQFTPELFMEVTAKNVMKQKSFHKGMQQLVQEGAVQLYRSYQTGDYILGAVGQLQFEVFKFRMQNEYNTEVIMKPIGSRIARWIDPEQLDPKMSSSRNLLVKDMADQPLFLFENQFAEHWFQEKYPQVKLTAKL